MNCTSSTLMTSQVQAGEAYMREHALADGVAHNKAARDTLKD